jgi:hypothetical protein
MIFKYLTYYKYTISYIIIMETNIKLKKELNLKDKKINDLEIELINYKHKLINKEKDLEIKELQIRELLAVNIYNTEKIESLKKFIKNNNKKSAINEQEKNKILSKSPETMINNIDIKNIFQLNNKISNEHDFALIFVNNKITKYILLSDKSRYKVSYINKNSELIKDKECNKLSNLIYSLSKDSAEKFIKDYNTLENEVEKNKLINGKGNTTKAKKLLSYKKDLATKIINKNDKSIEKFGKFLIRYSNPPIKYTMNTNI